MLSHLKQSSASVVTSQPDLCASVGISSVHIMLLMKCEIRNNCRKFQLMCEIFDEHGQFQPVCTGEVEELNDRQIMAFGSLTFSMLAKYKEHTSMLIESCFSI